jgi:hypothetical protein
MLMHALNVVWLTWEGAAILHIHIPSHTPTHPPPNTHAHPCMASHAMQGSMVSVWNRIHHGQTVSFAAWEGMAVCTMLRAIWRYASHPQRPSASRAVEPNAALSHAYPKCRLVGHLALSTSTPLH